MTQEFYTYQTELIELGRYLMIENIKMLLYKADEDIFETLDFENDSIYQEPLLYAYFNDKNNKIQLDQILYGYIELSKRIGEITITTDMLSQLLLFNEFNHLNTTGVTNYMY